MARHHHTPHSESKHGKMHSGHDHHDHDHGLHYDTPMHVQQVKYHGHGAHHSGCCDHPRKAEANCSGDGYKHRGRR